MSITGYNAIGVSKADPNNQYVWVRWIEARTAMDVAVAEAEQRGMETGYKIRYREYGQGVSDERERISRGVNLIDSVDWALNPEAAVLAVIDNEEGRQ